MSSEETVQAIRRVEEILHEASRWPVCLKLTVPVGLTIDLENAARDQGVSVSELIEQIIRGRAGRIPDTWLPEHLRRKEMRAK